MLGWEVRSEVLAPVVSVSHMPLTDDSECSQIAFSNKQLEKDMNQVVDFSLLPLLLFPSHL